MTARVLDGASLAAQLRAEVAGRAVRLRQGGKVPRLAVVLVGDDPASAVYVAAKTKAARESQVDAVDIRLPATATEAEVLATVGRLSDDAAVDGILVQLPLPPHIRAEVVIDAIAPDKDVDGLSVYNQGRLLLGRPDFVPCTPKGCMKLLRLVHESLSGMRAVVLGRSSLVGKPMALLLAQADATVTLCHSKTRSLANEVRSADIVVAAIGRPRMVEASWLQPGATVIDVGINRLPSGGLAGDVDYQPSLSVAGAITPVPKGVGPMTIACLLENTVEAAEAHVASAS